MSLTRSFLASLLLLGLAACEEEGNPYAPDGADNGDDNGEEDDNGNGDEELECHDLENEGGEVTLEQVAQQMPEPDGGTPLGDGIYELTQARVYTGDGGSSGSTETIYRGRMRLQGSEADMVIDYGEGSLEWSGTMSFETFGELDFNVSCPVGESSPFDGYTWTSTYLVLYDSVSNERLTFWPE